MKTPTIHPRSAGSRAAHRLAGWALLLCLTLLFVLATHWPLVSTRAVVYNDANALLQNPFLQDSARTVVAAAAQDALTAPWVSSFYRTLSLCSFRLDQRLGSTPDAPEPSRLLNLSLHLANVVLVMFLLFRLFPLRGLAAVGALLFGVHPFAVECIAQFGGRSILLAAFWMLCALIGYAAFARSPRRSLSYGAALACYGLALLSDIRSAPLPLLLVLLEIWPLKTFSARRLLPLSPFLAICFFLLFKEASQLSSLPSAWLLESPALLKTLLLGSFLPAATLYRILWPQQLSFVYALPHPFQLSTPGAFFSLLVVLAAAALVLVAARRGHTAPGVCALAFLAILLPAVAFVHPAELRGADGFAYLAFLPLWLLAVCYLAPLWQATRPGLFPSYRQIFITIGALYLAGFIARTTQIYAKAWSDTASLFGYMASQNRSSDSLNIALGRVCLEEGRASDAISFFAEAIRINPKNDEALLALTGALTSQGRSREAVDYLERALTGGPGDGPLYTALGAALIQRGEYSAALEQLARAQELDPDHLETRLQIGHAHRLLEHHDEAVQAYRDVIRASPDTAQAHAYLAFLLGSTAKAEEAATEYREVLRLRPDDADSMTNLGILLNRLNESEEAIRWLTRAVELRPGDTKAIYALGFAVEGRGDFETALSHYREALRLDPNFRNAEIRIGIVQSKQESAEAKLSGTEPESALVEETPAAEPEPPPAPPEKRRRKWLRF